MTDEQAEVLGQLSEWLDSAVAACICALDSPFPILASRAVSTPAVAISVADAAAPATAPSVTTRRRTSRTPRRKSTSTIRFDLDALTRLAPEITLPMLARRAGVCRKTMYQWRDEGLPEYFADELAIALGLHPAIVWPAEWAAVA